MRLFYTDQYIIPLPQNHSFPIQKYAILRKRLFESDKFTDEDFCVPHAATWEAISRVHDARYLQRLKNGELTAQEIRLIGLPWSKEIVERARRSAGATIEACRHALTERVAVNLGGGTHHAFCDRGQGYCWLNDAAIASRTLQTEKRARKILIVDCDVHQGNGTAAIFNNDPTVFTFSIHGKNNFPFRKEKSDLDIALADGTGDGQYLRELKRGLKLSFDQIEADLVIYLAGADPYNDDRFGRLALTKNGLAERDRTVLRHSFEAGLPVAVTMAGGYARRVEDTVDIHFQTVLAAAEFEKWNKHA